jgi:calcineurin-like phosphoesterase family protein
MIKIVDWHDNWFPEEDEDMKTFICSDTHFNHQNITTYCDRPTDFTERIIKNWNQIVKPDDLIIHLGDVQIGKKSDWIIPALPGKKILVRGNHDRQWSNLRWMKAGFDFACDGLMFRNCWLTHEPAKSLPEGAELNLHGHLHNIWHGFHPNDPKYGDFSANDVMKHERLNNPWQRLFAIEYTNYAPVDFESFVAKPDKYQARGPKKAL